MRVDLPASTCPRMTRERCVRVVDWSLVRMCWGNLGGLDVSTLVIGLGGGGAARDIPLLMPAAFGFGFAAFLI